MRTAWKVCLTLCLALCLAGPAAAGEVDTLVEKLVEKGILSRQDAVEILTEVREAARQEHAQTVAEVRQAVASDVAARVVDLPRWISNTHVKGDFRLRYQMNDRRRSTDRHRGRYRLRVGVVTEVTDQVHVGFGVATGGSDPRSTNQSMTNSFESPDLRLDYAYVSYRPFGWLKLTGGKFKNPLWVTTDLLWDSDIRPEGVSLQADWKASEWLGLFVNGGFWVLDERSSEESDPSMAVLQPGAVIDMTDRLRLKMAATYYNFANVRGGLLDHSAGSNTINAVTGGLAHDYDAVSLAAELGLRGVSDLVPYCGVFGEYVSNLQTSSDDAGFAAGLCVGHKKVRKRHQWQLKGLYRRLERDAWLDIFPDSDAYGGATNVKGWEFIATYAVFNNVSLSLDYYYMENIRGPEVAENILQLDLNVTF